MEGSEGGTREQLAALSDVLNAMSGSPSELEPVLHAVIENAVRLCGATNGSIVRLEGHHLRLVVSAGTFVDPAGYHDYWRERRITTDRTSVTGRVLMDRASVQIEDVLADSGYQKTTQVAAEGVRTMLGVPLIREGSILGVILLRRTEVARFTTDQVRLVEAFADQAAIAIENVRLFDQTREALEQQAATAEVLKTISRSVFDLDRVLETVVENAARLAGGDFSWMTHRDGDIVRAGARYGRTPELQELFERVAPLKPGDPMPVRDRRPSPMMKVLADGRTRVISDLAAEPGVDAPMAAAVGSRSVVFAPLARANMVIGALAVARQTVRPFTEREIEVIETFADQAAIAIENVRLFSETKEALDRQTAVSEILRVIAGSPTDVQPVLDAIAESAARFCGAENVSVILQRGDGLLHPSGHIGTLNTAVPPFPLSRETVTGRSMLEGRPVHVHDLQAESSEYPLGSTQALAMGHRTTLATPLTQGGRAFGAILMRRAEVRPFTEHQIELVQTFADQAVIAIENVRLFNETKEALERQTAVSNILKVISTSPTDIRPVLSAIAESAVRFCGAEDAAVVLVRGDQLRVTAHHGPIPSFLEAPREDLDWPADRTSVTGRAIVERRTILVDDIQTESDAEYSVGKRLSREPLGGGALLERTTLATPLIREGHAVGAILLRRLEVRPFTEKQIELVETFAAQAAIAIENVRLFNETKEALERQTAVSDILKVISASPTEIQPVLDAIASSAARFTGAEDASVLLVRGDVAETRAHHGPIRNPFSVPLDRGSVSGAAILDARLIHVADVTEGDDYPVSKRLSLENDGQRTVLAAPLVRDGQAIGAIVLRRKQVRGLTERQVELVRTFADQAIIAIENVRLFNETKEALDQQTATSEVLQAISRSAFDLQSVLDTVVERAAQLCGAEQAWMRRIEGDDFRFSAYYGASSELRAMFEVLRLDGAMARIDRSGMGGRAIVERRPIHVHDILADETLREASLARRGGGRTALAVPMLRNGEPMGAIVVARNRVSPFNEREIRLVETFADQAVIAIENVRLFSEIQDTSRQLEIAGRHKSEFLANMSHELRTPLNAIIGFSEVLLQGMFGELNEKQREYQQDVLSSGRHLLSLINDILDLSKIEAGRVELELGAFSLPAALDNGVTMVRERAARHGIRVTVEIDGVDLIVADERKVKQIVANLLSNAVKFTPDGGRVEVRAARENSEVRIAVRDTGIGIDASDRERIFLEFQQASRDPERSREGTGLGLALSKRYVELHGGRIWVESEVGQGSTFTFSLPLVAAGKEG